MTLLILKDYFLIEQFVTQKVYTVYLCALWISSVFFLLPLMCVCALADVWVLKCQITDQM